MKASKQKEKYCPSFDEGDEVFITIKDRRLKATVVMREGLFVYIEDIDGVVHSVLADECIKVCKGCDGYGTIFYEARQVGGDIIGPDEVECRLCKGTGEEGHEDDDYDPDCVY